MLTDVVRQVDDDDGRVAGGESRQAIERGVGTRVVDEDDLATDVEVTRDVEDLMRESVHRVGVPVHRHDHAQVGRAGISHDVARAV